MGNGLTILQQRFVDVLFAMSEPNQRKAYMQVYKNTKRPEVADVCACQALKRPKVAAYLQSLRDKATERTGITAAKVIKELAKIGFSNIEDYLTVDEDGETHLKNFDEIERATLAAIESIKISITNNKDESRTYTTTQFKLCSKLHALEQLGKHFGIYQKDNEQKAQTIFDILAIVGINGNGHEGTKAISGQVG